MGVGWKTFQILIGGETGIVEGLENFPNINSQRGGGEDFPKL